MTDVKGNVLCGRHAFIPSFFVEFAETGFAIRLAPPRRWFGKISFQQLFYNGLNALVYRQSHFQKALRTPTSSSSGQETIYFSA